MDPQWKEDQPRSAAKVGTMIYNSVPPSPTIGQQAIVPSIHVSWKFPDMEFVGNLPLFGPLHSDELETPHIHVDLRFVSDQYLAQRSLPPQLRVVVFPSLPEGHTYAPIVNRPFICMREWPTFPYKVASAIPIFEVEMCNKKMVNMTCPHRGASLESCPIVNDEVVCPIHGLKWNTKTGDLVLQRWSIDVGDLVPSQS